MASFTVKSRTLSAPATVVVTANTREQAIYQVVATGAAGTEVQVQSCV
jgi:hypothetical protein